MIPNMIPKKCSFLLFFSFVISGCSSSLLQSPLDKHASVFIAPSQAGQMLAEKEPCCEDLSQLQFHDINNDDTLYIPLTNDSQVYPFAAGKSFVQAYKLTNNATKINLTVSSLIAKTALKPQIMLLDANFNATRTISSDKFIYQKPSMLNGDQLTTELTISRPQLDNILNETYLIFYTTEETIAGSTTIEHPAKTFAIAHSNEPPNIADPIIPHSAMGLIKLEIDFEEMQDDNYIPVVTAPATQVDVKTEEQYNAAIADAVEAQQIDHALNLVEQAEAAGSATARETFINALKKHQ